MSDTAARALQSARRRADLSQEELSARSGVSERTIRSLESGRAKRPHRDTLVALAQGLGLASEAAAGFVASWRESTRSMLELFDDAPTEQALRDALDRQRHALRERMVHAETLIDADRRWQEIRVRRVFEVVAGEVDTFLFGTSYPTGQPGFELLPEKCANVEPVDSMDIANSQARAYLLSLGGPHGPGSECNIAYALRYAAATDPTAPLDTETLFAVQSTLAVLSLEVRFHPDAVPARAYRLRQPTVDGPQVPAGELPISPYGYVHIVDMPVTNGVNGIGWEWD